MKSKHCNSLTVYKFKFVCIYAIHFYFIPVFKSVSLVEIIPIVSFKFVFELSLSSILLLHPVTHCLPIVTDVNFGLSVVSEINGEGWGVSLFFPCEEA